MPLSKGELIADYLANIMPTKQMASGAMRTTFDALADQLDKVAALPFLYHKNSGALLRIKVYYEDWESPSMLPKSAQSIQAPEPKPHLPPAKDEREKLIREFHAACASAMRQSGGLLLTADEVKKTVKQHFHIESVASATEDQLREMIAYLK